MNRRQFTHHGLGTLTAALIASPTMASAAADDQPVVSKPMPVELDKALAIDVRSPGVRWREAMIHLVRLDTARFSLDLDSNHLTASISGRIQTFDKVDYDVSVAVLSDQGKLLGVARTQCKVPRFWAGRYGNQQVKLAMDFGISKDFDGPLSFLASISNRTVLTPDQWNKGD